MSCFTLWLGSGKSVILAEIIRRTTENKNHVLFLVHRKELIDQ
ncbi:DEAD/DEAH box helicase family protein, partial [Listeria monocytogenes]